MLKRRSKRRYVSIMYGGQPTDSVTAITKRFCELFGSIATQKAAIRLVGSSRDEAIIRCRLEQIDNVLVAITLIDPPAITLDISGTLKQLASRKGYDSFRKRTPLH